jgi:Na+/H+-dicarboxylate symporter
MTETIHKKNHLFPLLMLAGIAVGAMLGVIFKQDIIFIKPLGDIFLNLLITSVTPLVFFSISSCIASISNFSRLSKIISGMMGIFVLTGIIASLLMIVVVINFMPEGSFSLQMQNHQALGNIDFGSKFASSLTTSNFYQLLDKKHMLALILFSGIIGVAISTLGEKGQALLNVLLSGKEVMIKVIKIIMYYAPIGLGAYFAYIIGKFGPKLMGDYAHIVLIYYPVTLCYFLIAFSFYAYLAGGFAAIKRFWKNSLNPMMISFLTGSSNATIPANLIAAEAMGVSKDIREVVIPLGATIHMDGSCLAAILKIAVLFSLFNIPFSGFDTLMMVLGVALLTGIVMSGVTDGGFVGETLIITLFGFPPAAFPIIAMIGILVDPPATTINSVGDTVAGMMLSRWLKEDSPKPK